MRTSAESMSRYKETNGLWNDLYEEKGNLKVDFKTAKRAVQAIWRREMQQRSFPYPIVQTAGNRHTWVRQGTLYINCNKGWSSINHSWSHWLGYRRHFSRPHCAEHACLELRGAQMILDKYVQESIEAIAKPKQQKAKVDMVVLRYKRMLARQTSWARKLKLAETHCTKVNKEIQQYLTRHGGRLA